MADCPQHIFQVLTKRSERLRELASELIWAPNIWMGVNVENIRMDQRIRDLQRVPAVGFLSCGPLKGPCGRLPLKRIHWVIVGGESGQGARPMEKEWVESIHEQYQKSSVAFFFKQWGGVRKHVHGRDLKGKTYDEMPIVAA